MNPEWRLRYEAALEVTRRAAQKALGYFEAVVAVEWKNDQSPVTVADRETEQELRSSLQRLFPGDGFLGEEYGVVPGTSGFRWVLDPIDGTRSFVRGIPVWATLVGLEYKGEQIAGVASAPALGQTWHALRGGGAFRDAKPIRVSEVSELSESLLGQADFRSVPLGERAAAAPADEEPEVVTERGAGHRGRDDPPKR